MARDDEPVGLDGHNEHHGDNDRAGGIDRVGGSDRAGGNAFNGGSARDGSAELGGSDLLPARMLNEFAYCPRLFHLMHVEREWADNEFTIDGRRVHRRVDALDHVLPERDAGADPAREAHGATDSDAARAQEDPGGEEPPEVSRSVTLGSARLGIVAKLDIVSSDGAEAVPVERKRGKVPANEERSWEPERVQLMAQGLLLREHGFHVDHGILYYAGSRRRVGITFTPELEAATLRYIELARAQAGSSVIPDPLHDSPKCHGCSLNGICLPDETLALQEAPPDPVAPEVRRLYPVRSDATPLYVQEQGARVGTEKGILVVRTPDERHVTARFGDIDQLVLLGNVQITAQALHTLCEAGIPVVHCSTGHWFYGLTAGLGIRNGYDKAAQFAAAADPERRLDVARRFVRAKVQNQRTLLRRNAQPASSAAAALADLDLSLRETDRAGSIDELLGVEGNAARTYFASFGAMLRPPDGGLEFAFSDRNRRPPRDPVNALLSFGYAMLAKDCTIALLAANLEPHWGLYHAPRHGRPALALDLMEEFRPVVVDSAVITAVNTGMVRGRGFVRGKSGCVLKAESKKAFIEAFEARMEQLVTHPVFDYRVSWRSVVRLQARLLARYLRGDVAHYVGMTTR